MQGGPGGKTFLERCCLGLDAHEVKESAVYHVAFWSVRQREEQVLGAVRIKYNCAYKTRQVASS